jgi:pimeloyl-ACP methyl ester carboxylesterase
MTYEALDVPVDGGLLRVGRWGTGSQVLLAIHGITANHISFQRLASELGEDVTVIAPDLRGRGGSGTLPPPYGIRRHAEDVRAVLDHLGVEQAVVLGHSMGAWVATTFAITNPARVSRLVIVDGGVALPIPDGVSVDDMLTAVLGAAMARLSMTFESRDAYVDFWRVHPALSGDQWSDDLEAYIDYDLVGEPPALRSSVSVDAVRGDATEQLTDPDVRDGIDRVTQPAIFLRAPRGLDNGAPLYPRDVLDALHPSWPTVTDIIDVEDVNHYTIVIGDGATAVAGHVRAALDA